MKKEFYNYLLKKLLSYFEENLNKVGERYYLQLDEDNQVEEFYKVLSEYEKSEQFIYKHEKGDQYETIAIDINGIKLVVATTVNTTPAYLVTVRNCSSEQIKGWEKTAIFVVCAEPLDSIKGGCKDLRRDGMPFNVISISKNLKQEIENSELTKTDKEISKFYVEQKLSDLYNTSLWDYQEILSIINKKQIEAEDYKRIGLFRDLGLEGLNSKEIKTRLKENHNFFDKVQNLQEYEDKKTQLEKDFDDKGINLLTKDNWHEIEFNKVKTSYENNKKEDRPLKYQGMNNKKTEDGLVIWEREKCDTAAGRRSRNIIIFNNNSNDDIKLEFNFDDKLNRSDIKDGAEYVKLSNDKLFIEVQGDVSENKFYKITYKHKNQNKSKYDFNIAVININPNTLEKMKSKYEVVIKRNIGKIKVSNDNEGLNFGNGANKAEVEVNEFGEIVEVTTEKTVKISSYSTGWQDDRLEFKIKDDRGTLEIEAIEETSRINKIDSIRLWKAKREKLDDFNWNDNRVRIDTSEFYIDEKLKHILLLEKEIIMNNVVYGEKKLDLIEAKEIVLSEKLMNAYSDIISYFKRINNIPSLTYINDELKELYVRYLDIFNLEIEEIKEADILSNNKGKMNLLKLGTIEDGSTIMMSPLSPLNIAYQLEIYNQLKDEELEPHILERLRSNNLLPYMYSKEGCLLRPIYQKDNIEWIIYDKSEKVSIGETNAFVSRLVKEKIIQFINHFKYLFILNSNAPIKINLINVKNDKEVVRGVFDYVKEQIFKKSKKIVPVEIKIYNNYKESSFDEFFSYKSIERLEEDFDIKLDNKTGDLDKVDVIRLVLENIKYYKFENDGQYDYSHISFYKIGQDDRYAKDTMSKMETGLALNGVISTTASNNNNFNYRSGFGKKNILDRKELLIRTAINLNELASNVDNDGENPYRKDQVIVTKPLMIDEESKKNLYDSSHWITFIEPNFGLEYFDDGVDNDTVVIHYSDQYTASDQYDTITVTSKSKQYIYIVEEFLKKKDITINEEEANKIIKSFNSINGEWLLNLIANKSEFDREKLSIIAAIKYGLAILNHEDIMWIPVSLEEILRVSNAVKLNKSDGLFSLKNLKKNGIHSDDLIFIGVNIKDLNNLKVYYYPVEVKIGYNFETVIEKGMTQIDKTYSLIKEQLFGNGEDVFKNKFFRNFFVQLFIANEQKFVVNGLWKEKELERINDIKKYLLNDKYDVSFSLEKFIGKGALISFKKENHWRSVKLEEDKLMIELTENDAYHGIKKDIEDIYKEIIEGVSDLDKGNLLCSKEVEESVKVENKDIAEFNEEKIEDEIGKEIYIKEDKKIFGKEERVLLGEVDGGSKEIYWEFGSKELSNRHLLITGKSGQGKTYFIQCALKELIDNGIPAIIIDYTEGFKLSQLETEFKDYLGDRLENYLVAKDKFPLNPFELGKKELDENEYIDEDEMDVAERFKSIIAAVYKDLGAQQLNTVYEAVLRGFETFNGRLNLKGLKQILEEEDSSYSKSVLGQIGMLLNRDPFEENKEFSWDRIDNSNGKVFIIQLSGFRREIQKVITEIILWDLWNYKLQNGSKDKPFAVILDECQNLDFKESSPSTKILTEGRKFGWSAWFATQFLRGQMDKATMSRLQNSGHKIYFAQTEEEAAGMSATLAVDSDEKKKWAKELINLKKGQCISYGPIKCENDEIISKPVKIKIKSLTDRI